MRYKFSLLSICLAIVIGGIALLIGGVWVVESNSHERHLRYCWQKWEGRDVRYDRQIGCQVRDPVGWVPEKNVLVRVP